MSSQNRSTVMSLTALLLGAGLGAGLMYILDPTSGSRRRRLVRDKAIRGYHSVSDYARGTAVDLKHRAAGYAHTVRARFSKEPVDDQTLIERVRSQLGRVVSHPSAVEVCASAGSVTLAGPILANEVETLLRTVRSVRGVQQVSNQLDVHETPENISALQG